MHSSLFSFLARFSLPLSCLVVALGLAAVYATSNAQSTGYTCMPAPGSVGGPAVIPGGSGGGGVSASGVESNPPVIYSGGGATETLSASGWAVVTKTGSALTYTNRIVDPEGEWNGSRLTAKGGWYAITGVMGGTYTGSHGCGSGGLPFSIDMVKNGSATEGSFGVASTNTYGNVNVSNPAYCFNVLLKEGDYVEFKPSFSVSGCSSTNATLSVNGSNDSRHYISIKRSYTKP